jgi:hypothetical protein
MLISVRRINQLTILSPSLGNYSIVSLPQFHIGNVALKMVILRGTRGSTLAIPKDTIAVKMCVCPQIKSSRSNISPPILLFMDLTDLLAV